MRAPRLSASRFIGAGVVLVVSALTVAACGPSDPVAAPEVVTDDVEEQAPICPGRVPSELGLDGFYEQHCDVLGIPLVASGTVEVGALLQAEVLMRQMLAHRPDIAGALATSDVRVGIIGEDEVTTDMPEWSDLNTAFPGTNWNVRARGLGATVARPLVGAGEENLLCLPSDPYLGESIFVHEFAHTVFEFGAEAVEPGIDRRLDDAYRSALESGLWADTYAATNRLEYWAEGVQSFFDTNLADDFQHNEVDTREELAEYDPALYALIAEVFGEEAWRPTCPGLPASGR